MIDMIISIIETRHAKRKRI